MMSLIVPRHSSQVGLPIRISLTSQSFRDCIKLLILISSTNDNDEFLIFFVFFTLSNANTFFPINLPRNSEPVIVTTLSKMDDAKNTGY